MSIISKKKLYAGLILSMTVLIFGYYLSSKFENKWINLLGHITSLIIAMYVMLGLKVKLPNRVVNYRISPSTFFYISIGVLGLYFVLEWQFKISIATLLGRDYIDIMTYKITSFKVIESIVIFPIIEELFFRRVISQKIYLKKGFHQALWISSILFSIAHIYSSTNLIGAFLVGLFLGYIYLKTDNIWLSIFAHALFNALLLFLSPSISDLILGITEYWVFGIFILFSLSLIFVMTFQINRINENNELKEIRDEITYR